MVRVFADRLYNDCEFSWTGKNREFKISPDNPSRPLIGWLAALGVVFIWSGWVVVSRLGVIQTLTIYDMVAEGDMVAVRWSFSGTHKGELPGSPPLPATGKKIEVQAQAIHRVAGDKLAETWVNFDAMGMMQQLGVIPTAE